MKRMLDSMSFRTAASQWDLPESGYNRCCPPMQLTEQLLAVSAAGFSTRHIVLARQSIKRKAAPGKMLSLFVGPDIKKMMALWCDGDKPEPAICGRAGAAIGDGQVVRIAS